jgi:hypothetical protein
MTEDGYDGPENRKVTIDQNELVTIVREAVRAELGGEFMVPVVKHYNDHELFRSCMEHQSEMKANHEFVSGIRNIHSQAKDITVKIGLTGAVTFCLYAIYYSIKESLR